MSVFMNFYDPKEVSKVLNQDTECLADLKQMKIWVCFIITESDGKTNKTPTAPDLPAARIWAL